jgi:hypothetical protein
MFQLYIQMAAYVTKAGLKASERHLRYVFCESYRFIVNFSYYPLKFDIDGFGKDN